MSALPRPATLARWSAVLLCFLIALELACRIEDRIAFGIPLFSRVVQPEDLIVTDSLGARGRPHARFHKWQLDSLGFRGPELTRARLPGSLRVVVEGASESFGLYESSGREYPRQLEDSLRAALQRRCAPESPPLIEVVNAALPGMSLPTMQSHLRQVIAPLQPDVVVLYPSPAFYMDAAPPSATRPVAGPPRELSWRKAAQPRFLGRIRDQFKGVLPEVLLTWLRKSWVEREIRRHPPAWHFGSVPPARLSQWETDLRNAVGAARGVGAQVVLLGHANATMRPGFADQNLLIAWERMFPNTTGPALAHFHELAVEATRSIARDSGATFVDLPAAFRGHWEGSFADFVHFTDSGAAIVAGALAPAVLEAVHPPLGCRVGGG